MRRYLYLSTAVAGVMMMSGNANAQCVTSQDCTTLGYTQTSCPDGKGLKCPFGNKWYCPPSTQDTCRAEGFTLACNGTEQIGGSDACGGLYKKCACNSTYKYACTGTGYAGGSGTACGGKYTACKCASGYEWKNGTCQQLNGAQGELYYCNGKVVGVRATGMEFYVAMKNLGSMTWSTANSQCRNYSFCGNVKGTLPTALQLSTLYSNKSRVNSLLSTNGGTKLIENYYWSSSYNGYYYVVVHMSNGLENWYNSSDHYYVRPVLAF